MTSVLFLLFTINHNNVHNKNSPRKQTAGGYIPVLAIYTDIQTHTHIHKHADADIIYLKWHKVELGGASI